MLKRKIYDELLKWKSREHHCLLVKGQRQVGKTFIIDYFGKKEYENYYYVNFEINKKFKKIFDGDLDVNTIVKTMGLFLGKTIPEGSLIFLDEIQDCPNARSSLKSFSIDGRYDVIASGSLLGVDNYRTKSEKRPLLPVGYEEHLTMYSLDFEEFLWAIGKHENEIEFVKELLIEKKELPEAILCEMSARFLDFMIVGGMPRSVVKYVEDNSFVSSSFELKKIKDTFINDMNRYNQRREALKTTECFLSIPNQLSQSNKKFMYSRINGDGKRKSHDKYMENLLWIKDAGYGNFCYGVRTPQIPLVGQKIPDFFKVYMSDTGFLVSMYGEETSRAIFECQTEVNLGAIAENIAAECMTKAGYEIFCYRKTNTENKMELDFLIEANGLVLIEIKSGKKREIPSMEKALRIFEFDRKLMFEMGNIRVDEKGIEHYPLFAIGFIEKIAPKREIRSAHGY